MPTKIPLIVRLPNWVGDVVMTLPSLYALHAVGFDLQLMGRPWIVDLLQALPATLYSQQSGFRQGASKCKRKYMTNQPLAPAKAGGQHSQKLKCAKYTPNRIESTQDNHGFQ